MGALILVLRMVTDEQKHFGYCLQLFILFSRHHRLAMLEFELWGRPTDTS